MKLAAIAEALSLKPLTGDEGLDNEVSGAYVGDLLSHVIARARPGNVWVTVQAHANVIAVAVLTGLSGVVLAEGVAINPATIEKAREEHIPVFSSDRTAFEVAAGLVRVGVGSFE